MSAPHTSSDSLPQQSANHWFAEDVYTHDASLKAYLRGSFPAVRDVDDVVQESYLRIWKAQATQQIKSAKAFLFTVARRLALDSVRHQRRSPISGVTDLARTDVLNHAPDAAETASTAQEIEMLAAAVDSLPHRCREIFILRRLQGMPQKEIALRLGISEQTVQVQVARGLRKIEEIMSRKLKGER